MTSLLCITDIELKTDLARPRFRFSSVIHDSVEQDLFFCHS